MPVRACWIMQLRNPQACVTVPHPQLVHNVHAIRSHRRCGIVCSSAPPPPPPLPLACRLPLGMCCCTYALHVSLFPDFITGVELAVPGNPRQHPVPAEKGDTEDADGVENSPPFYQDLPFVPPPPPPPVTDTGLVASVARKCRPTEDRMSCQSYLWHVPPQAKSE